MERKLAAILAADVAGYSALMEVDEAGTFERLRARHKDLFEPEVDRYHGRIFKVMGDGLLAEFGSVVDAVECAAALQRGMMERNDNFPESNRIEIRIGINLGEVIIEGEDRYGEGVNIAARLQSLADPGGICVSAKVSREVEKKLTYAFEPMGEQWVKNITEPIACYRVNLNATSPGVSKVLMQNGSAAPKRISIAVLPFSNMSGDPEQEYFSDGITEDIITDLSKISHLHVIARNTTRAGQRRYSRSLRTSASGSCWRAVFAKRDHAFVSLDSWSTVRTAVTSGPSAMTVNLPTSLRFKTKSPTPSSIS